MGLFDGGHSPPAARLTNSEKIRPTGAHTKNETYIRQHVHTNVRKFRLDRSAPSSNHSWMNIVRFMPLSVATVLQSWMGSI